MTLALSGGRLNNEPSKPQGRAMEGIVTWWCHLIGITDQLSIQIATGIAGAALAYAIIMLLIAGVSYALAAFVRD